MFSNQKCCNGKTGLISVFYNFFFKLLVYSLLLVVGRQEGCMAHNSAASAISNNLLLGMGQTSLKMCRLINIVVSDLFSFVYLPCGI